MKQTKKKHHKKRSIERKHSKSIRRHTHKHIIAPSTTPLDVQKVSDRIAKGLFFHKKTSRNSYSPTINQDLVSLKSIPRKEIEHCNTREAFALKEPLQIGIPGTLFGKKCFNYNTIQAKKYLLRNLAANKHVQPMKIVPPIQMQANCWFNAMFTTFFVSDKGRKFFHFFRQLMIEGKQKNGNTIGESLKNAFALLNFGIESSLFGNKYAYELNTNNVIQQIYLSIPTKYKANYKYIADVNQSGNPILYYLSIINYLNNNSLLLHYLNSATSNTWKPQLQQRINGTRHLPHIIVLEVYDDESTKFKTKPLSFTIQNATYKLDSAIIRDKTKQHFCATITCEGEEMGYDGMSFKRLVSLTWKDKLNSNYFWQFEGSNNSDGTPLEWSFTNGYQMLMYYRV